MLLKTNEPAPTVASRPIFIPHIITDPEPIDTPSSMKVFSKIQSSFFFNSPLLLVDFGFRSLIKVTL